MMGKDCTGGFRTRPNRRSIRLKGYDYSQPGAYFITICTQGRECLFGEVVDGEMRLNEYGDMVRQCWLAIPDHFPHTALDAFVIMPNHVHGVIWIMDATTAAGGNVGATHASPLPLPPQSAPSQPSALPLPPQSAPSQPSALPQQFERPPGPKRQSLGAIIGSYKSAVTRRINQHRGTPGVPVWQRNYYEHIIRTDRALDAIRRCILQNPLRWHLDRYNYAATGPDPLARDLWNLLQADGAKMPSTNHGGE